MTVTTTNVSAKVINVEAVPHVGSQYGPGALEIIGIGDTSTLDHSLSWLQVLEKNGDQQLEYNNLKGKTLQYSLYNNGNSPIPSSCFIEGGNGSGENSTITELVKITDYWPYWSDDTWFSVDIWARGSWIGSHQFWRVFLKYKPADSGGINCAVYGSYGKNKKYTNLVGATGIDGPPASSTGYGVIPSKNLAMWAWKPHITKSGSGAAKEGRIRVYYNYADRTVWATWQYNGKKTNAKNATVTILQMNVWPPDTYTQQVRGTGFYAEPRDPDVDDVKIDSTQYPHIQLLGSNINDYFDNYTTGSAGFYTGASYDENTPGNASTIIACPRTGGTADQNKGLTMIDSSGSTDCCFDPEANVLMHDNSYKKIKDIVVGDLVKNQANGINTVLQIETPIVGNRLMYKFNDRFAFVSEEHPLMTTEGWGAFNPDCIVVEEEWKGKLVKIDIGTKLIVMDQSGNLSEELITSLQTEIRDYNYTIYNLMLDGDHTFIVEGVVVHNKKIICTAMNEAYGFGGFRNAIWLNYAKDNLTKHHEAGYHKLALPFLNLAYNRGEKNSMLIRMFLEHIVRHRTADLWKLKKGKIDPLGRIYRIVLEPLVYLLGKIISYKDKI